MPIADEGNSPTATAASAAASIELRFPRSPVLPARSTILVSFGSSLVAEARVFPLLTPAKTRPPAENLQTDLGPAGIRGNPFREPEKRLHFRGLVTTSVAAAPARDGGAETERLYAKYGEQLYRYCHARLRSREDAEDAVQSTFIRVHGALGKGVTPRFEAAWLYKIAHNVCLSRSEVTGRRAKHETPRDLSELEWAIAAPETSRDELMGLSEALGSMPKNLRDPILLREWQGLSYVEIAEALDTSVSAVETLIFRGRRHLAAALEPVAKRPRRVLAGLLDMGTVYSALRVLLAQLRGVAIAAGPVKLAAGAAVVALGGAGLERATADHPATQAAPRTTTAQLATATSNAPEASPVSRTQTVVRTGPAVHVASTFPAAAPTAAVPPPAAPAAVTPESPAATPEQPAAGLPAAQPPVPPVDVPTVTPPDAVTVPAMTVASVVDTPALPLPPVTVPVVSVPTVSVPAVSVPAVTTPVLPVAVP
jgi:RNA polymerase sigma factor (sigma-70 family)